MAAQGERGVQVGEGFGEETDAQQGRRPIRQRQAVQLEDDSQLKLESSSLPSFDNFIDHDQLLEWSCFNTLNAMPKFLSGLDLVRHFKMHKKTLMHPLSLSSSHPLPSPEEFMRCH